MQKMRAPMVVAALLCCARSAFAALNDPCTSVVCDRDSVVVQSHVVRLDKSFLTKMDAVRRAMAAASRRGPARWYNVDGMWIGIKGTDTTHVSVVSLSDLSRRDIDERIRQIRNSPVRNALESARWDPEDYVIATHVISQSVQVLFIEELNGPARTRTFVQSYKVTVRPLVNDFVRANRAELARLGFPRAAVN